MKARYTTSFHTMTLNNNRATTWNFQDFQEFLRSDYLAGRRLALKVRGCIYPITGSISLLASSAIIYRILCSYQGLSTTYHRLVFGLCIGDLLSSLAFTFSSFLSPKEMNYIIPYAIGTSATCSAQGFVVTFGMQCVSQYNRQMQQKIRLYQGAARTMVSCGFYPRSFVLFYLMPDTKCVQYDR